MHIKRWSRRHICQTNISNSHAPSINRIACDISYRVVNRHSVHNQIGHLETEVVHPAAVFACRIQRIFDVFPAEGVVSSRNQAAHADPTVLFTCNTGDGIAQIVDIEVQLVAAELVVLATHLPAESHKGVCRRQNTCFESRHFQITNIKTHGGIDTVNRSRRLTHPWEFSIKRWSRILDHAVAGTAVFGDELKRLRNRDFAKDKIFIRKNRAVVSFV